ncbi:Methyltransferase domain-containing protein [Azospirillaceae bacterium]
MQSNNIPPSIEERELARARSFQQVWTEDLNAVFSDVAHYYDKANFFASFGLWGWFLRCFMKTIKIQPHQRVLDVCAGTNAIGIALLKREPTLKVDAMDRSASMQEVGQENARALGFHINSTIGDVHDLPFPDNHFDVVTLQFATRHLRVKRVFEEIRRVLKPGGHFYHCDMLRPTHPLVVLFYYHLVSLSLIFTSALFGSGKAALKCRRYFVMALKLFYSADELSEVLTAFGFVNTTQSTILSGAIGFHCGQKPFTE